MAALLRVCKTTTTNLYVKFAALLPIEEIKGLIDLELEKQSRGEIDAKLEMIGRKAFPACDISAIDVTCTAGC